MAYDGGTHAKSMAAQNIIQALEAPPFTHSTNVLPGNGSDKGIFAKMFIELAKPGADTDTLMIASGDITA